MANLQQNRFQQEQDDSQIVDITIDQDLNTSVQPFQQMTLGQHPYDSLSCKSQQSNDFMMDNRINHQSQEQSVNEGSNTSVIRGNLLSAKMSDLNSSSILKLDQKSQAESNSLMGEERIGINYLDKEEKRNQQSPVKSAKDVKEEKGLASSLQMSAIKINNSSILSSKQKKKVIELQGRAGSKYAENKDFSQESTNSGQRGDKVLKNDDIELNLSTSRVSQKRKQKVCIEIVFRKFKIKSSVTALVAIFILFFIAQLILEGIKGQNRTCAAYSIGCMLQAQITNHGEVHRLIISSLLHSSFMQIACSIFTMLFYGFVLEDNFGLKKMLIIYFSSALAGNLFQGLATPYELSIGPSSIIISLLCIQLSFLKSIWSRVPYGKKKPLIGIFIVIFVSNVFCTIESKTVSIFNIIGGLICGVLLSINLCFPLPQKLQNMKLISIVVLNIFLIILFIVGITRNLQEVNVNESQLCHKS